MGLIQCIHTHRILADRFEYEVPLLTFDDMIMFAGIERKFIRNPIESLAK